MVTMFYTVFSVLDFILQLIASIFAYQIYTFHQLSKGWLAVPLGFLLLAIRRIIILSFELGYIQTEVFRPFVDSVFLPFIISLLLVIGIWVMYNNFQKFSILQKDVSNKVESFKKTKKRR